MKRVFSFSLNDFTDIIKENAGRGKKSFQISRRVAFAVKIIKKNLYYKHFSLNLNQTKPNQPEKKS